MAEVDDFLAWALPTLHDVETAFHQGDPKPRYELWSHEDPVTLNGALLTKRGWTELAPAFEFLASRFSDCRSYENEVIAAGSSVDLAYLVAHESTTVSISGAPAEAYELRVTSIFRREDGRWRQVHRHADPMPHSEEARRQLARF